MTILAVLNLIFAVAEVALYFRLFIKKRHHFDLWATFIMLFYAYCYWDVCTGHPTSTIMLRLAATALFTLLIGKALIEQ